VAATASQKNIKIMTELNKPTTLSGSEIPNHEMADVALSDEQAPSSANRVEPATQTDTEAETITDTVTSTVADKQQHLSISPSTMSLLGNEDAKWDTSTKRMVLGILLIAFIFIIWLSRPIVSILIFSSIVAYLLKPIVDLAERIRIPRAASTVLIFLLLAVASIVVPIVLAPILVEQLGLLISFDRNAIVRDLVAWIEQSLANLPQEDIVITLLGDRTFTIPVGETVKQVEESIQRFTFIPTLAGILNYFQTAVGTATNVVGSATAISFTVVGGIVQFLVTTILVFVVSLYLTKDAPKIRMYVEDLFPRSYQPELMGLLKRIGGIWQAFFRGQIVLCLVIGSITTATLYLLGMPGALVLGIFAGAMEIIPNLGPALALIPALIVALIQGSTNPALMELGNMGSLGFALLIIGVYFVIQQIENSIIVPRVIGDSVNLHPVVIICGVYIGFSIGGILGAFLAAPVIATVRTIGSYIHAKLLDYEPFVDEDLPLASSGMQPTVYRRTVTGKELAARDQAAVRQLGSDDLPETDEGDSLLDESTVING